MRTSCSAETLVDRGEELTVGWRHYSFPTWKRDDGRDKRQPAPGHKLGDEPCLRSVASAGGDVPTVQCSAVQHKAAARRRGIKTCTKAGELTRFKQNESVLVAYPQERSSLANCVVASWTNQCYSGTKEQNVLPRHCKLFCVEIVFSR